MFAPRCRSRRTRRERHPLCHPGLSARHRPHCDGRSQRRKHRQRTALILRWEDSGRHLRFRTAIPMAFGNGSRVSLYAKRLVPPPPLYPPSKDGPIRSRLSAAGRRACGCGFSHERGPCDPHDEAYNGDRNIMTGNPYRKLISDLQKRSVRVAERGMQVFARIDRVGVAGDDGA